MRATDRPTKARILCVDNRASRNLAIYLLRRDGHEVAAASSVTEALRLADGAAFDLALLNQKLVLSAAQPCRELAELASRAPILLYTTAIYPFRHRPAARRAVPGHGVKPVQVSEVAKTVSHYLRHGTWPAGPTGCHVERAKGRGLAAAPKVLAGLGVGAALLLVATKAGRRGARAAGGLLFALAPAGTKR